MKYEHDLVLHCRPVRSREASKQRESGLDLFNRFEIWPNLAVSSLHEIGR